MFDNTNPYTLRTETIGEATRYHVAFIKNDKIKWEEEVSYAVYLALFDRFVKKERNLRRFDERHTEQYDLTDRKLNKRILHPSKSVEDTVIDGLRNERLRQVIAELPEIQRRRFLLYYESELTYEQIAVTEGCTFQAVAKSIKAAEKTIKKTLRIRVEKSTLSVETGERFFSFTCFLLLWR